MLPDLAWLAALVALAVSTILLLPLHRLLFRLGVLDPVGSRSLHQSPTPRGAGLALAAGMISGLVSVGALTAASLIALGGFAFVGAWDDWKSRSPRLRLLAQVLVAALVVSGLAVSEMRRPLSQVALVIVGICLFVLVVNVVNFMDGANGLSAMHGVLFGSAYAAICWQAKAPTWMTLAFCLSAAYAAFIPWNLRKKALFFLGDSGSYLLGASLTLLVLGCWVQGVAFLVALAPLTVYLGDVSLTLVRRVVAKRPVFEAHREHAYQVLPARGWDHRKASLLVLAFSGVCCVLALIAQAEIISLALLAVLVTLVVMAYFVTIRKLSFN